MVVAHVLFSIGRGVTTVHTDANFTNAAVTGDTRHNKPYPVDGWIGKARYSMSYDKPGSLWIEDTAGICCVF